MRLVGDAGLMIEALSNALPRRDLSVHGGARAALEAEIARGKQAFRDEAAAVMISDAASLRPERLMADLDTVLTPDTIVTTDAGYSSLWVTNYLIAQKAGLRFLTPRGPTPRGLAGPS